MGTVNPAYPKNLGGERIARMRRAVNLVGGLRYLSKEQRRMYGAAVSEAIRSLQRSELLRAGAPLPRAALLGEARRNALRAAFQRQCDRDFKNGVKHLTPWPHTPVCKCEICQK